ncbi:MAG: hypothetical protein IKP42_03450 [Ruminococcus sp.]|nr:hypothetical protein [Ruminococcus sp.]
MKIFKLDCPYCGANLECKDGLDSFYCMYCGGKVMLEGMSKDAYIAKVKIKKMEHDLEAATSYYNYETEMKNMEYEHESNLKKIEKEHEKLKIQTNHKQTIILISIMFSLVIISLIGLEIPFFVSRAKVHSLEKLETEIMQDIADKDYDSALFKANQLYYDSDWSSKEKEAWDAKRENYIGIILDKKRENDKKGIFIPAPDSSDNLEGEKYTKVKEMFTSAGFTNVLVKKSSEKKGLFDWKNTVEHITISGKSKFEADETFDKESQVIIYYYSKE